MKNCAFCGEEVEDNTCYPCLERIKKGMDNLDKVKALQLTNEYANTFSLITRGTNFHSNKFSASCSISYDTMEYAKFDVSKEILKTISSKIAEGILQKLTIREEEKYLGAGRELIGEVYILSENEMKELIEKVYSNGLKDGSY